MILEGLNLGQQQSDAQQCKDCESGYEKEVQKEDVNINIILLIVMMIARRAHIITPSLKLLAAVFCKMLRAAWMPKVTLVH